MNFTAIFYVDNMKIQTIRIDADTKDDAYRQAEKIKRQFLSPRVWFALRSA